MALISNNANLKLGRLIAAKRSEQILSLLECNMEAKFKNWKESRSKNYYGTYIFIVILTIEVS